MRRLLIIALVLSVALPMTSCRRAVEKARENIRIEGVEKVEPLGLTGAEVVLRVKNDTGHKLVLDKAKLDLYYAQSRVGTVSLRDRVEVERRTTGSVPTQWQVKISDPLALYVLTRKLRQNDISQMSVSFTLEGRGGPAPVNISRGMMPLSEFLNIFDIDLQSVKNFLKE